MLAVTAILSCVIKIPGLFKSTNWRHFQNVKFEALSARREMVIIGFDNKDMNKLYKKEFMSKVLIQIHQILKLVEKVIHIFFI